MADHTHELRDLAGDESGVPQRAWIERGEGDEVDCALARTGRYTWEARPPAPVIVWPGDHLRVDRLGPNCTVTFQDVLAASLSSDK